MITTGNIGTIRSQRWSQPRASWGLVPTMGYLHEGHLSLVRQACLENDHVAVSIYVNPTQFAHGEDLDAYPRDIERDLALLKELNVDIVFVPGDEIMYPEGFQTKVELANVTRVLEGRSRPSHFQGVTTVVTKLFNIVQPTRAYFGQKDAQQAVVIGQLVSDLNFNLDLVICPIIREPDGLAMSSRNIRLNSAQRAAATALSKALDSGTAALKNGEKDARVLRQIMIEVIQSEPIAELEYASVANPYTLEELSAIELDALLSLAVSFGAVRLIDNSLVQLTAATVGSKNRSRRLTETGYPPGPPE